MIELTRDDLVAIRNALGERYPIDERDHAIYRAGLAAGITTLRERIAALEKDAERWRAVHELDGDQMDAFVAAHWINPEALNATIDAAIDAARAALDATDSSLRT